MSDAPLIKVFAGRTELLAIARRVAGTLFQPVVVLVGIEPQTQRPITDIL
jgi:hypothetical protein